MKMVLLYLTETQLVLQSHLHLLVHSPFAIHVSVNYLVPKGSSAYVRYTLEMAEWWRQDYVMESNWAVESFSTTRTVDGNYLCRYEFDLPDKSNYSHLVIRVYYKVGVAVWFNSVPLFNDNLMCS